MKRYLTTLIQEKGKQLDDTLVVPGHFGVTFEMLLDFIEQCPEQHAFIKDTLVKIDFQNGDVFHFFTHLATCMCRATDKVRG